MYCLAMVYKLGSENNLREFLLSLYPAHVNPVDQTQINSLTGECSSHLTTPCHTFLGRSKLLMEVISGFIFPTSTCLRSITYSF